MVDFEDNNIENMVLNLQQLEDIFHAEVLAQAGTPTVAALASVSVSGNVAVITAVSLVLSALSIKKRKMTGQLVCHYEGIRCPLTKGNKAYVILKNYNDHF